MLSFNALGQLLLSMYILNAKKCNIDSGPANIAAPVAFAEYGLKLSKRRATDRRLNNSNCNLSRLTV